MSKNAKQKHICYLTSGHPPFDERIFHKEAKTLAKAGYEVVLIAQHDREEVVDGVRIIPLPKARSRVERMTKGLWRLFKLALKQKADIYHFHDPELVPIGLILKFWGKKVIYDVHELFFFSIGDNILLGPKFLRKFIQHVYLLFEKLSIKRFDRLVLAEDDYENYYRKLYKNFCGDVMVRNFPILPLIDKASVCSHLDRDTPIVIYAGGLSRMRGAMEMVRAAGFLEGRVRLYLLGNWEDKQLAKECESLDGWRYTSYLGFLPLSEVYRYMKGSDIGLSILYPVRNYLTSLPCKAYEYMACSLPMVMSNFPCWQDVFGECALFADPYNPKDMADKILCLLDNPDKARRLGERGRQLTIEKYNWETEGKKLVELYRELLK